MALTLRRKLFVDLLIETGDRAGAYLDAGYKVKNNSRVLAAKYASELLTFPEVKAYYQERIDQIMDEKIPRLKEILGFYADVMAGRQLDVTVSQKGEVIHHEPKITDRMAAAKELYKRLGLDEKMLQAQLDNAKARGVDPADVFGTVTLVRGDRRKHSDEQDN